MKLVAVLAFITAVVATPTGTFTSNATVTKRAADVTHTGTATWFHPGLGACGFTDNDSSHIVAMSQSFYDDNRGGNCGQGLSITYNGKTVTASMHDSCPGCGYYDLDLSPAVFTEFEPESVGVLNGMTWHFNA